MNGTFSGDLFFQYGGIIAAETHSLASSHLSRHLQIMIYTTPRVICDICAPLCDTIGGSVDVRAPPGHERDAPRGSERQDAPRGPAGRYQRAQRRRHEQRRSHRSYPQGTARCPLPIVDIKLSVLVDHLPVQFRLARMQDTSRLPAWVWFWLRATRIYLLRYPDGLRLHLRTTVVRQRLGMVHYGVCDRFITMSWRERTVIGTVNRYRHLTSKH